MGKNVFKEVLNRKLGIFYSIKNRIKPVVKELIFIFATPLKTMFFAGNREVAQAGSAPGLGPGGRRFESCLPDKKESGSPDAKGRPDGIGFSPTPKDRLDFNRGVPD